MTEWKAKRFWTAADAVAVETGWGVALDGRAVNTPGKVPLVVPTQALAAGIAAEWDAQADVIDPRGMPLTRAANSAIEKVAPQIDAVVTEIAGYGQSDLLCYRAEAPDGLVAEQALRWDPWLAWAAHALDAPLHVTRGVMPIRQPAESLSSLRARVAELDAFALTGFHDLVALSGSLVLAFATTAGKLAPGDAWSVSRVDEEWQIGQWGEDDDARAAEKIKRAAFLDAAHFFELSRRTA